MGQRTFSESDCVSETRGLWGLISEQNYLDEAEALDKEKTK